MSLKAVKGLFLLAAVYDVVLGIVFGLFYAPVYERYGMELPNHPAYVQLLGLYVFTIGIGFLFVYQDPVRNAAIITLGILMKIWFCLVAFGHWSVDNLPVVYKPIAVADLVFLLLFLAAVVSVRKAAAIAYAR